MENGEWRMEWRIENGELRMENGEWNGEWKNREWV